MTNDRLSMPQVHPAPALRPPLWSAIVLPAAALLVALVGALGAVLCGPIGALLAVPPALAWVATAKERGVPLRPWATMALGHACLVAATTVVAALAFLSLSVPPPHAVGFALALALASWIATLPTAPWVKRADVPILALTGGGGALFLLLAVAHTLGFSHPLSLQTAPWALWACVAGGAAVAVAVAHDDWPRNRTDAPHRSAAADWARISLWTFAGSAAAVLAFPALDIGARVLPAAAAGLLAAAATAALHLAARPLPHLAARALPRVPEGEMEATAEALAAALHAALARAGWRAGAIAHVSLMPRNALFHPEKGEHVQVVVRTATALHVWEKDAITAWKTSAQDALDKAWGRAVLVGGLDAVCADLVPSSAHHALQRASLLAAQQASHGTAHAPTPTPRKHGMRRVA